MPKLVSRLTQMASFFTGLKKLGQPVPESNLASERNRRLPQPTQ